MVWRCRSTGLYKDQRVQDISFSNDGSLLAVLYEQAATLWDADRNVLLRVLAVPSPAQAKVSPLRYLAFAGTAAAPALLVASAGAHRNASAAQDAGVVAGEGGRLTSFDLLTCSVQWSWRAGGRIDGLAAEGAGGNRARADQGGRVAVSVASHGTAPASPSSPRSAATAPSPKALADTLVVFGGNTATATGGGGGGGSALGSGGAGSPPLPDAAWRLSAGIEAAVWLGASGRRPAGLVALTGAMDLVALGMGAAAPGAAAAGQQGFASAADEDGSAAAAAAHGFQAMFGKNGLKGVRSAKSQAGGGPGSSGGGSIGVATKSLLAELLDAPTHVLPPATALCG